MKYTSQTGLLSSVPKRIEKKPKHVMFNMEVDVKHAPFTTKPLTGLFNPFSRGCSILCNHPAVPEVKRMLQKAKGRLNEEGKSTLLPDEVAAIRAELEIFHLKNQPEPNSDTPEDITEIVPEELFRKYTETDSRPLTPTPTLASAHTRASATRRCVTPDPIITSEIKEKTLLVLDLRRSHSQETLSCYGGSSSMNDMPLIRIMNVNLTPASSRHSLTRISLDKPKNPSKTSTKHLSVQDIDKTKEKSPKNSSTDQLHVPKIDNYDKTLSKNQDGDQEHDSDEEYVKRRGKKRKKRRASSSVSIFRTTTDPETLVAGVEADSKNPSARPSLNEQGIKEIADLVKNKLDSNRSFNVDSFLDYESLRVLRRELNQEVVEMEFDARRKMALEEALKTLAEIRVDCEELKELQRSILLPTIDAGFRLSIPQKFSRRNVRFELPMDSRVLNGMTPMDYLKDNVYISSPRKLLYMFIFNLHRNKEDDSMESENVNQENQEEVDLRPKEDVIREISGNNIIPALGVIMNKPLNATQTNDFHQLIGWDLNKNYKFQEFSAICAVCERLLAVEFYPNLPGRDEDPSEAIEIIDFEALERKTKGKTMDTRLLKLLNMIKIA